MGKVFFDGAFAYIVSDGECLDGGVVYDDFLYAVFLAFRKFVVVKVYGAVCLAFVSVTEQKVDAADRAE